MLPNAQASTMLPKDDGPLKLVVPEGGPSVELHGTQVSGAPAPVPNAAELMARVNSIGDTLRALIVETKRLPREKGCEPHQDPVRSLAQAQVHLQTGFMWLRRAIEAPKVF